ncbi:hypothetical protein BH20VER3_BH20VER3_16520 [soil metagenome]
METKRIEIRVPVVVVDSFASFEKPQGGASKVGNKIDAAWSKSHATTA